MSNRGCISSGIGSGSGTREIRLISTTISSRPATVPNTAIQNPSVRSCCTSLRRLAPSATRTAISRLRAVARASRSPATLAQAIARMRPTATSSTPKKAPTVARLPNCSVEPTGANEPDLAELSLSWTRRHELRARSDHRRPACGHALPFLQAADELQTGGVAGRSRSGITARPSGR